MIEEVIAHFKCGTQSAPSSANRDGPTCFLGACRFLAVVGFGSGIGANILLRHAVQTRPTSTSTLRQATCARLWVSPAAQHEPQGLGPCPFRTIHLPGLLEQLELLPGSPRFTRDPLTPAHCPYYMNCVGGAGANQLRRRGAADPPRPALCRVLQPGASLFSGAGLVEQQPEHPVRHASRFAW